MADSLPSRGREFDLSSESGYVRHELAFARMFMAGAAVFLALLGIWSALSVPTVGPLEGWGIAVVLWGLAALFAHLAVQMKRTPPLNRIRLGRDSIWLRFEDGFETTMTWTDPGFGLGLFDYSHNPGSTRSEGRHVWIVIAGGRGGSVSQEVSGAIVASARAAAIPVLERMEVTGPGRLAEVTRIGRPEATPGWKDAIAPPLKPSKPA